MGQFVIDSKQVKHAPHRMVDDVIDGYVSIDAAADIYGTVIVPDGDGYALDEAATNALLVIFNG